jgi:hypothetical protein
MAIHVLELTPPFEDDGDGVKKTAFLATVHDLGSWS